MVNWPREVTWNMETQIVQHDVEYYEKVRVGIVAVYLAARNFGFIYNEELGRIFFRIERFERKTHPPIDGEAVSFQLKKSDIPGKPDKAWNVRPLVDASALIAVLDPKVERRCGMDALATPKKEVR